MSQARDYSLFDAEISGAVLDWSLLKRLGHWMRPYRATFGLSAILILLTSTLQVLLPIIISLVVIDHIIRQSSEGPAPDLGMIDLNDWLVATLNIHPLLAACGVYALLQLAWAVTGHAHRLTLASAVTKSLRDLRLDLFRHLETRPSSFYDRVAVGRVMTRVTNDIEALYELLRGVGTLVGEFVPFFVALAIMLAVDVQLTLILLLALPIMAAATYLFRRTTRRLFRLVRMSLSALNQYMQENLAGLAVVQLSGREPANASHYQQINKENRSHEMRSVRWETLYGAFNDSMAHIALGAILWFGGGAVVQDSITLGGIILFTRFIDMLFHPVVALGEQTNVLFRAMASCERIFQALDWDESIHEPSNPRALPGRLQGAVEFRNLSFEYEPGQR
ncbi:MAG: ABC transporter ATP-binding protein, partial [Pseudomonadales bacterium]